MNNDEMREEIAKLMGWTNLRWREDKRINKIDRLHGDKGNLKNCRVPNYPEDLNAMHDVECFIMCKGWSLMYYDQLGSLVKRDFLATGGFPASPINAKPGQRAEAVLRVLNLWKEPK